MDEKIKIEQYHDWWFDNAIEFLGHLLEDLKISVDWSRGISFDPLNDNQITQLAERIDVLIKFKLSYGDEKEKRTYLPPIHKGKYSNFLGKDTKEKQNICNYLFSFSGNKGKKYCDICSCNYDDQYGISQVSQTIYPVVIGSLKSQCGVRKMESEYHACPRCAFLGSIEWLDDNPFACDKENLVNYILLPKIEDLSRLHIFKQVLRRSLNQSHFSNLIHGRYLAKQGVEKEVYARDQYSLLLSLFEQLKKNIDRINRREDILCDDWISIKIEGADNSYKTRYTYLEEISIPNILSLERILNEIISPYSNLIDKSFAKYLVGSKENKILTHESKYLMSKGLIMDDFNLFAKAFQVRQNCTITGMSSDILIQLIYLWRCKNAI